MGVGLKIIYHLETYNLRPVNDRLQSKALTYTSSVHKYLKGELVGDGLEIIDL